MHRATQTTNMRNVGGIILLLSLALLASAQVPKMCSTPSEYPHTRLAPKYTSRQKYGIGEKVYYGCAEDFTPSKGSPVVQCVDGSWTKLNLKCEKISCGNAGDLPNGNFLYEGNSFLGEKVHAVCNEGYTLKGLNYMICKKSGWTGDFPTCEEGEPVATQLPDKERCGVPVIMKNSNANLANKYITMTSFASGDRVYYVCDVGYVHTGGSRHRQCIEGKWTPLNLKCGRKLCGSAGEIAHGQFSYNGVSFGDTATAVCDEGYHLVGQGTRNCMSNGWDGRVPVCEAVGCAEPSEVANADMEGRQEPPYTYRSVVRYYCRVGTLTGQHEIWCTKDGTWSAPAPKCKEITCASPKVLNASWMGARLKRYQYKTTIEIVCNPGYRRFGTSTITCGIDGQWSPRLPRCRPDRTSRRN